MICRQHRRLGNVRIIFLTRDVEGGPRLSCPVMQADGAIDIAVPLCGIEKQLDTAPLRLPLVSDNCLHYVTLGLLVFDEDSRRAVARFECLAGAVEELFISHEIPLRTLV